MRNRCLIIALVCRVFLSIGQIVGSDNASTVMYKAQLIGKMTCLPKVLAFSIAEYVPEVPPIVVPLFDGIEKIYQYDGSHERNMPDFYILKKAAWGLEGMGVGSFTYASCREEDFARTHYGDETIEYIRGRVYERLPIAQRRSSYVATMAGYGVYEPYFRDKYKISYDAVLFATYLVEKIKVAWISTDTHVYKRALEESAVLLASGTQLSDIGRGMDGMYQQAKRMMQGAQ